MVCWNFWAPWEVERGLQLAVPEGRRARGVVRASRCPGRKAEGIAPWTPASSLLELGPEEVPRPWRRGARLWRLLGEGASCTWRRGPAMGARGALRGKTPWLLALLPVRWLLLREGQGAGGVEEAGAEGEKSATAGQPWSREKGAPCAEERRTGVVAGKDSRGKGTMGVSSEIWAPSMEAATAALCSSSGMGGRRAGDAMGGAGRAPHSWKRELAATGRGGAEPPARWLLCVGGRRAAA